MGDRSVFRSETVLCGAFVWARRARNSQKRRFLVRAAVATKRHDEPAADWREDYGKYMDLSGKSSDGKRRGKTSKRLKTLEPTWGEVLGPIRRYNPALLVKIKAAGAVGRLEPFGCRLVDAIGGSPYTIYEAASEWLCGPWPGHGVRLGPGAEPGLPRADRAVVSPGCHAAETDRQ